MLYLQHCIYSVFPQDSLSRFGKQDMTIRLNSSLLPENQKEINKIKCIPLDKECGNTNLIAINRLVLFTKNVHNIPQYIYL